VITLKHRKIKYMGMNIIEVVVGMIILLIAFMALGFVYPRGRLMTDQSRFAMQATEIARSITEEIKLMPLRSSPLAVMNPNNLALIGLLPAVGPGNTGNNVCLRNILGTNGEQLINWNWPYHHFAGPDWRNNIPVALGIDGSNATEIQNNLNTSADFPNKRYFLPKQQIGNMNRGILIDGDIAGVHQNNAGAADPDMAAIAVTVAWIESRNGGLVLNHVTLTSLRTENLYN